MEEMQKHYRMMIKAIGPIHIGDGQKIGKKEYIYLRSKRRVFVPDLRKMTAGLQERNLLQAYEKYLLYDGRSDLQLWLKENGCTEKDFRAWESYELEAGDAFLRPEGGNSRPPKEINTFVKDVYGNPYVPGSSIKGMLRTALLSYELRHASGKKEDQKEILKEELEREAAVQNCKRKKYLSQQIKDLEVHAFHTLNRKADKPKDMVNSCLSELIVSDSKPISRKNLTLCQKIDVKLNGKKAPFPILRESLIPGTEIYFELTINKGFPYTIEQIMEALNEFQQISYKAFYSRFKRGKNEKGIVWLGGGCGFLSKTIIYPLYEKKGVKVTDQIFQKTLGEKYRKHHHNTDVSNDIAPHVCKCTYYHGVLYDMGMGQIRILRD